MAKNKTTKRRISLSHALFLISGITLIIYYFIKKGVPSIGNNVVSVMNFIVDVFVIFLLFFFYFFILFKTRDNLSTTTAIAPSLLILIIVGHYSMNFGNQIANSVITSIAEMFYLLILVCGVVMLFIPEKLLGMIFSFSCLGYAFFVMVSYIVVLIISLVNSEAFSLAKMFETMLYTGSLALLFGGAYYSNKNKAW